MIIEGYTENPFPYEIGTHLLDEDGDECILEDATYFNCRLHWLTGSLATQGDGRFTARTEVVHEDFKRKNER
jgi:hypothetical protein